MHIAGMDCEREAVGMLVVASPTLSIPVVVVESHILLQHSPCFIISIVHHR